ncbi:MT-A70-domain-containing protein [Apiosordaria backusii]|uniref:MT-A70-domain-containing protein n=1 Tax=Apiosordaria backusii TaxID=314023 RepID=A0AA40EHA6_9PEZI|nr:MT-A70-domain-containing protein [Apiosordaria backusii]
MRSSSILWQNEDKTVVLVDLPRSIEEAQCLSHKQLPPGQDSTNATTPFRRLISSPAPEHPFFTPEPKSSNYAQSATSHSSQIAELMTIASVESALEDTKASYQGPWCLPRITSKPAKPDELDSKNSKPNKEVETAEAFNKANQPKGPPTPLKKQQTTAEPNPLTSSTTAEPKSPPSFYLPPNSHPLTGPFPPSLPHHQKFNLLLLDPPWPNRSAKRKRSGPSSYTPLPSLSSTSQLLCSLPIATLLSPSPSSLLAIWVTNSPRFTDLLLNPKTGIFANNWGVELVGEWIWLKVTSNGEPIVDLGSQWRKPYERLLIARRKGVGMKTGVVKRKVIVSVPDIHSRKPNLKRLFEEEEEDGLLPEGYTAMEMFARNSTAGWWGWGDEVVKFQGREYWVEEDETEVKEDKEKEEGRGTKVVISGKLAEVDEEQLAGCTGKVER